MMMMMMRHHHHPTTFSIHCAIAYRSSKELIKTLLLE
jgi:hypothetical protein